MARPTSLRILGERSVDAVDEIDMRTTQEVFGSSPSATHTLDADVLAILNQSHARIEGVVAEATQSAERATQRAELAETAARSAVDEVNATGARLLQDVKREQQGAQVRAAAGIAAVGIIHRTVAAFSSLVTFLVDRAPVLFALIAAFLLWRDTQADPTVLKLVGLGLFGACAVAPAVWFSSRK